MELLDAYELVRFTPAFRERLEKAHDRIAKDDALSAERSWLSAAIERLAAVDPGTGLLEKVRDLPELTDVRADFAEAQQNAWVDALEKLLAGITFHAGSRAPVIEALFPHQKFPALRRATLETATPYWAELERRFKSSYVTRTLAQDDFTFARPVIDQISAAWAGWQACFSPSGLSEEEAAPLREELLSAANRLNRVIRQARLLAEAALLPEEGAFEAEGLHQKPKKRTAKPHATPVAAPEPPAPEPEPTEPPPAKEKAPRKRAAKS